VEETLDITTTIRDLFTTQRLGALSTQGEGKPYANLVAFAATDDLRHLIFATTRTTRKYANIANDGSVALLIDNRKNSETDFHKAIAVTATGTAKEVPGDKHDDMLKLYLAKHPHLRDFVKSPNCALLCVDVEYYYLVNTFQNVTVLDLREESNDD
jgi:nitroimidazol reductase NimA-like FMN-containing flavoprotein (pyridoxamine 5'-phosphate oxidase superfamily)